MIRLTVFIGVAVLALVSPTPTAVPRSAGDAPWSSPTLQVPDDERVTPPRDPSLARATPRISSHPDDRANRARLDEAWERFSRAGLLLPDLEVVFSESDDACGGHYGRFDPNSNPWRVTVCSELGFVLTHELAHAWTAANLDDAERASYLAHRDLPAWNDSDLGWRERGTEDAAFMMQQVLMSKRFQPPSVWAERIEAFEQLTGRPCPPDPSPTWTDAIRKEEALHRWSDGVWCRSASGRGGGAAPGTLWRADRPEPAQDTSERGRLARSDVPACDITTNRRLGTPHLTAEERLRSSNCSSCRSWIPLAPTIGIDGFTRRESATPSWMKRTKSIPHRW